jgi:putative pyruvate formate lyase activating enzyme
MSATISSQPLAEAMPPPIYRAAFNNGSLERRAAEALKRLQHCDICPRHCGVNRLDDNNAGYCRTGRRAIVCSYFAHHGEEPPVSGTHGSGIIFFSRCNMSCVYCQNYAFSQQEEGRAMTAEEIAGCMLELQDQGCSNINFATPTHVVPQILEALVLAARHGLSIPLVYNTSGYENVETLRWLDGIVDIYLPDMRYANEAIARRYSNAPDYPSHNQAAIREMWRQTGPAVFNENGDITRGTIIRHLVLPGGLSGTPAILRFLHDEISPEIPISLMSQYFPAFHANQHPPLDRRLHPGEFDAAVELLHKLGFENGWVQESGGLDRFQGTNIKRNV